MIISTLHFGDIVHGKCERVSWNNYVSRSVHPVMPFTYPLYITSSDNQVNDFISFILTLLYPIRMIGQCQFIIMLMIQYACLFIIIHYY